MTRRMILLGAALAIWTTGSTATMQARPAHPAIAPAAYAAVSAANAVRQASFQAPRASLRARSPHEPSTYSLLLVAVGLLSLRMHARVSSEKFSL